MGKFGTRSFWQAACLIVATTSAQADCLPGSVELRGVTGSVMRFSAELADSADERATGLMNRPEMASSAGMLFAYPEANHPYFWMKNTLIPLDMIFVDDAGLVTRVHSNAKPLDETPIDGGAGVRYVLEINGGLAAKLGLTEGAMLRSDVLDQTTAVWACSSE